MGTLGGSGDVGGWGVEGEESLSLVEESGGSMLSLSRGEWRWGFAGREGFVFSSARKEGNEGKGKRKGCQGSYFHSKESPMFFIAQF